MDSVYNTINQAKTKFTKFNQIQPKSHKLLDLETETRVTAGFVLMKDPRK